MAEAKVHCSILLEKEMLDWVKRSGLPVSTYIRKLLRDRRDQLEGKPETLKSLNGVR